MKADVVVLGGGPAGAVAATVLARGGLDVVVLEANPGPVAKIGENLPPAVRPVLERLGLFEAFVRDGHRPCHGHRSWWGADQPVEEDFLFGFFGDGWHVDRVRLERMLGTAATEAGARWGWDHHAVDARWSEGCWVLEVEGPEALVTVEAAFVVDATGRPARFARGAGARVQRYDKQVGVAVTLEPPCVGTDELDGLTLVEALPRGWWYTAPLREGRAVAAYITDGDLLDAAAARTPDGWLDLLEPAVHTRRRLAGHLRDGPTLVPRILPAGSARLLSPAGPGWLAVGDAAVAFDPLSSHGMGSAMTTGYYGACAVADHLHGTPGALDTYEGLVTQIFDDYLVRLRAHYGLERRWPAEPFWSRRHVTH